MPDATPYLPQRPRPTIPLRIRIGAGFVAAVLSGLLIWWVVTLVASNSPWSEYVQPGRADTMAEKIAENGPAFLSDLAGRQNDLYVFHDGGDYSEGWTAIGVFVPDMDGCVVEWDPTTETFQGRVLRDHVGDIGACEALSFDSVGTGLVHFRIWSDENRLKIDVNGGDIS